jgi:hypothetical protein
MPRRRTAVLCYALRGLLMGQDSTDSTTIGRTWPEGHADPEIPRSEALVAFLLTPYVEMVDDLARACRRGPARRPEAVSAPPPEAGGTP